MSIKSMFSVKDMTQGPPWKRIVEFAWPMLIGNIAQQLYNTADSIIVGKFVGDNALAAVGSAGPIVLLLISLFVGVSTGAGIVTAQYFGAKDRNNLSLCIGNCLTLCLFASIISMIIGLVITRPMLVLLGTPPSILDWCAGYLKICFWGIAGSFFYNILAGILRGMGDSLSALCFLLIAAVLNVGLDLLFVAKFGMGVSGVALATIMAQAISAICCFFKLLHMKEVFDLNLKTVRFNPAMAKHILRLGLPSGVTMCILSMASMAVQSLTNSLGEVVIACNVIIMRVDGFAMMPNFTFGQTMSVYTGQNVGARKFDRVMVGAKQGGLMSLAVSGAVTILLLFFGKFMFALFTDTPELIDLAVRMMRIIAVGYLCMSVTQVLGGVMRGAGDTVTPMWISIISTFVLRVPIAYAFAAITKSAEYPKGHPKALFFSLLISWFLGMLISVLAYRHGKWKKKMPTQLELG